MYSEGDSFFYSEFFDLPSIPYTLAATQSTHSITSPKHQDDKELSTCTSHHDDWTGQRRGIGKGEAVVLPCRSTCACSRRENAAQVRVAESSPSNVDCGAAQCGKAADA